jgi:Sortilin, neurotensin receptor 3,/Sortilin, neurotensin receptor 3, C-terminal
VECITTYAIGMILRFFTAPALLLALLLLSAPWRVEAKKDAPRIKSTEFDNALLNIFYFDDSDILLGLDGETGKVYRSINAGEDWKVVDESAQQKVWDVYPHPWDRNRAYIIGAEHTHWMTTDQGETWRKFNTDVIPYHFRPTIAFHGRDPKKGIFQGQSCAGWECKEVAYYTEDDFEHLHDLNEGSLGCSWAVSNPLFGIGIEPEVETRIFCIARGLFSPWASDNRMLVSDDYYKSEQEAMLAGSRSISGIVNMAPVKKYLVVAARAEGTDELALYVSDDSSQWHRAEFGKHKVMEEAYTILESTNYSMQVDVMGKGETGTLFTSNSNGTYFTKNIEHTNRGSRGYVDFEKITGIQGVYIVNVVENWEDVEKSGADRQITSKITFDDGLTFQDLKSGSKRLHLHSVTDPNNAGRVFSSPAPGIVMGVGNTGKRLQDYTDGDLYVSDDAGLTWKQALDGAHKYEFGDQGAVIVAIDDEDTTDHIKYSLNHGKDWSKADLGEAVRAKLLTTVPDSTSLKFLLEATKGLEWRLFMIDFEGLHERKCKEDDFEKWPARLDEDGEPSCVMGHKQFYRRRKADADCFVAEEFKDPLPQTETCKCSKQDFECDFNYVRSEDGTRCVPAGPMKPPAGDCKNPEDTFTASSGFRLIPGDDCERKGGAELDKEVERPCSDSGKVPDASGEIASEKTTFESNQFSEWHYLERTQSSSGDDESIIMRTADDKVFLTKDHGKQWLEILKGEKITSITPHRYFNDAIYFLTEGKKVFYSLERGDNVRDLEAPVPPHKDLTTLHFHPDYKDVLLWTGPKDCGKDCGVTYYTENRHEWTLLLQAVKKCEFIQREGRTSQEDDKNLVFCEQYESENPSKALQLVSSTNWFKARKTHFEDILDFATMSEFIIVAAKTEDRKFLKVDASVDGRVFAPAEFPPNFQVEHERAYTVLDSSTHAVFLHVTVNNEKGREYGSIIKSNSNGTSYSLALNNVNRDTDGFADFEKMQGLEGVAMVNVVDNVKEIESGKDKKLKSMITHNDGAEWTYVPPPGKDSEGNKFSCVSKPDVPTEKCSLHIHSYTERYDKHATFSSPSAIGIMLAVGNVGEYLTPRAGDDTHTFITRDGGITWTAVRKGSYLWEYGDQGSIILICEQAKPTQVVYYTLDEGATWVEYKFSDVDMEVQQISTTPSDNSRNFLLWGRDKGTDKVSTVNLDFTGLKERQRQCVLKETSPEDDDYELWEPKHPLQEGNCLFGHVAQYHRKKLDRECYNGFKTEGLHSIGKNCSCTRQDFEW